MPGVGLIRITKIQPVTWLFYSRRFIRIIPSIISILGKSSFIFKGQEYENHNKLLGKYPGMDGGKTGFISKAGYCLAASAKRSGHRLIAVVLGEPSEDSRNKQMTKLLDAAFSKVEQR